MGKRPPPSAPLRSSLLVRNIASSALLTGFDSATTPEPLVRDCRKKHKGLEPQRTQRAQRKRKAFLCVLCGSLLFRAFCNTLVRGWRKIFFASMPLITVINPMVPQACALSRATVTTRTGQGFEPLASKRLVTSKAF